MFNGQGKSRIWASRLLILILVLAGVVWQGRKLLVELQPPQDSLRDSFQEWASAKNYFTGLPIYTPQRLTGPLYRPEARFYPPRWFIEVNAHPPTAVLLAFPLVLLDYPNAHLAWDLFCLGLLGTSVWLIGRNLGWSATRGSLVLLGLVLASNPIREEMGLGQLNMVLLLLLTGTWLADRADRPWLAGLCLALAVAIKVMPVLLLLYFIVGRRWQVVRAWAVWLGVVLLATGAVLGFDAFLGYREALPRVMEWRGDFITGSISGLWIKLFDPGTKGYLVLPLYSSPALARFAMLTSSVLVLAILAVVIRRARSQCQRDLAFGLTVLAILLVSPLCWRHYFLLLVPLFAVLWARLPARGAGRWVLAALVLPLWLDPWRWQNALGVTPKPASPWLVVTAGSVQLYALLGLLLLGVYAARRTPQDLAETLYPPDVDRPTLEERLPALEQCPA